MGQSLVPLTPCWALEEVQVLLGLMACLGLIALLAAGALLFATAKVAR